MKISQYEYNSTLFDVDFKNRINLLVDDSGTGKTFLLQMLKFFCDDNNISCAHIDYIHKDMPLEGNDVLLFDKADLYVTSDMFDKLKDLDATSIISIKNTTDLDMYGDIGMYRLINSGKQIKVVKWG